MNWRFISEETFLSKEFSLGLLALHATLLLLFLGMKWKRYPPAPVFPGKHS